MGVGGILEPEAEVEAELNHEGGECVDQDGHERPESLGVMS